MRLNNRHKLLNRSAKQLEGGRVPGGGGQPAGVGAIKGGAQLLRATGGLLRKVQRWVWSGSMWIQSHAHSVGSARIGSP